MWSWNWLVHSDAGLLLRIAVGVAIFMALAVVDLRRRGHDATRWREYLVLVACTLAAMAYGAANDQITSAISWEYFYYGKDLAERLGPRTPPDSVRLHLAAAVIGIKATWSAGLIVGVALLLSNNPSNSLPRLPNRALLRRLTLVWGVAIVASAIGAILGHQGVPVRWNDDFADMLRLDQMRPRRFMTVYGIHMGAYVGGVVGTIAGCVSVQRARRRIRPRAGDTT
jgi:hypothetical protein